MAFGKRKTPPPAKDAVEEVLAPIVPPAVEIGGRLAALRDAMNRCFTQSAGLAQAIQSMDMLDVERFGPQWRPDQFPITITDFADLFATGSESQRSHALYAYAYPDSAEAPDRTAQVHLLDMTSGIMRLNAMCHRAQGQGVLPVVLHSPVMGEAVDGAIVRSAFFWAYFDAMLTAGNETASASADAMIELLMRRLEVAGGSMLAPDRLEELLPNRRWPFHGVELDYPAHDGERIIDEIYLPQDLAARVMQERAATPGAADDAIQEQDQDAAQVVEAAE